MSPRTFSLILPALAAASVFAQTPPKYLQNVINTVAGRDWIFPPQGGPATNAPLGNITSMALDSAGLLYIADPQNNVVFRIDGSGNISTFAGNGIQGFSGEGGPAVEASLSLPTGIAFDGAGNLYITDQGNQRIRKVGTDGNIHTIAGTGQSGFSPNGTPALQAQMLNPGEIHLDANGNVYFVDGGNNVIREISTAGVISTVAGDGTTATLNNPKSFAFDSQGNMFISDYGNSFIRKLAAGGAPNSLSIIAGKVPSAPGYFGDGGAAVSAKINMPWGLAFDPMGDLVFSDSANNVIRQINPAGIISTIAGNGTAQFAGDGMTPLAASFFVPAGVLVSPSGQTYIADRGNQRVRQFTAVGVVSTLAGNDQYRVVASTAAPTQTFLFGPQGIAIGAIAHDLLIAENRGNAVRDISVTGVVKKEAGLSLVGGYTRDGLTGANTLLNNPFGVAEGPDGTIYYADTGNNLVRAISPMDQTVKTIAGVQGMAGNNGDQMPGPSTYLNQPRAVLVDIAGDIFIADTGNNRILRIDATTGTATTYAGSVTGTAGYNGDGIKAVNALLTAPYGMAFFGNTLYLADQGNHRIRAITPTLMISTVAGTGSGAAPNGDGGAATAANVPSPFGITFDSAGNMFYSEYQYHVVREVTTQGLVFTVAGNQRPGFAGDGGLATASVLNFPAGVVIDPNSGYLYIADSGNDRVRAVIPVQPTIVASPTAVSLTASGGLTNNPDQIVNITALLNQNGVLGAGSAPLTGLAYTVTAADPWVVVSPATGTLPQSLLVSANATSLSAGPANSTVTVTAPGANPPSISFNVNAIVGPVLPAQLTANTSQLSLSAVQGAAPFSANISLANTGGGSINFNATETTVSGGNWLSLNATSGSFGNAAPYSLGVTVNSTQLAPGVYRGSVSVSGSSASGPITPVTIPVALTVSGSNQVIQLSQTALNFRTITTGSSPLPQTIGIQNIGQGAMSWTAGAVDVNGNPVPWVKLSASSGTVSASGTASALGVTVSPLNMTPGDYYAKILVGSAATNSPQTVTIVMTVLAANTATFADIQPSALIFTGAAGTVPSSQLVRIAAVGGANGKALSYTASGVTLDGTNWFTDVPRANTIAVNSPDRIVVQPDFTQLQPGSYTGNITLLFADGTTRTIKILSVVTAATTSQAISSLRPAAACSNNVLHVQFTPPLLSGSNSFTAYAGQQNTLGATVVYDCSGATFTGSNGQVTAYFRDGEPALSLAYNAASGSWSTAWSPPTNASATVAVQLTATGFNGANPAAGQSDTFVASLSPGASRVPLVTAGGVVSTASYQADVPIGVGGLISIFGSQLVNGSGSAAGGTPLPQSLDGTQVLLENQAVPILYASAGQINIQVPYETNVNVPQHLVVQSGGAISSPFAIQVASVQPAIFIQSVAGQGAIVNAATNIVAAPGNPVKAGTDVITIYCTGLGPTSPSVPTGSAATAPSYITTNGITVTIGGQNATLYYAGLTPGFPGLYQINALVPAGLSGNAVPVVVTLAGQVSPAATIAVQ
jgi:uncharacterized protein (TIGR03437 family)